jgi:hypothetical protein
LSRDLNASEPITGAWQSGCGARSPACRGRTGCRALRAAARRKRSRKYLSGAPGLSLSKKQQRKRQVGGMTVFVILHYRDAARTLECVRAYRGPGGRQPHGGGGQRLSRRLRTGACAPPTAATDASPCILNRENAGFARGNNLGVSYACRCSLAGFCGGPQRRRGNTVSPTSSPAYRGYLRLALPSTFSAPTSYLSPPACTRVPSSLRGCDARIRAQKGCIREAAVSPPY